MRDSSTSGGAWLGLEHPTNIITFSRFFVTFRTVSGVFCLPRMYLPQRSVPQFAPFHRLPERSMLSGI
jgi:hypothetical protein